MNHNVKKKFFAIYEKYHFGYQSTCKILKHQNYEVITDSV